MNDRIAVIGSANADRVTRVARLPSAGETVIGEAALVLPGGKGGNQAVAASKLDGKVAIVAAIGEDPDGEMLEAGWAGAGVDTTWVLRREDIGTGSANVMVDAAAENMIVVSPGANEHLPPTHVTQAIRKLQPGYIALSLEIPLSCAIAAAQTARDVGARVFANLSPRTEGDEALAQLSDVCVVNEHEASELLDITLNGAALDESSARLLLNRVTTLGCSAMVITRGAKTTIVADTLNRSINSVPAVPVKPHDTTGCGDAFMGALVVAAAEGRSLTDACRFANAAAAIAATAEGAQSSYATRSVVDESIGAIG